MHAEGGTYTRQPGGQSTSAGAATPFAAAGIFLDTCRRTAQRITLAYQTLRSILYVKRLCNRVKLQVRCAEGYCANLSLSVPVCGEGRGSH